MTVFIMSPLSISILDGLVFFLSPFSSLVLFCPISIQYRVAVFFRVMVTEESHSLSLNIYISLAPPVQ